MNKLFFVFLSMLCSIALTASAYAAGFALYEPSARANALGGATIAQGGDPSVLFSNPAAMARLPGLQVGFSSIVLQPKSYIMTSGTPPLFSEEGPVSQTSMADHIFVVPSTYITYQATDKLWLGLGTFSRFGLGTEFAQGWPGRCSSYYSKATSFEVNPNIAYRFTDKLSLSAGVSAMYFDIRMQKKIPGALLPWPVNDNNEIDQQFKGNSIGYGWNIGLHYQATDRIAIGLGYRSRVSQQVNGGVHFSGMTSNNWGTRFLIGDQISHIPSDVYATGEVTLPDELFLGVSFKPAKRLTWEIGGVRYGWSSYERLRIELARPVGTKRAVVIEKNWVDTWRFQTGVEYNVNDYMDLRFGYVYDKNPVPDETIDFVLPDSDRNIFGIGVGFHGGRWSMDLSFNYLIFSDRDMCARNLAKLGTNNPDKYPNDPNSEAYMPNSTLENGRGYIYGLSLGYKF